MNRRFSLSYTYLETPVASGVVLFMYSFLHRNDVQRKKLKLNVGDVISRYLHYI